MKTASLLEWLALPWEGDLPFQPPLPTGHLPADPSRLQVLTALVTLNGGQARVGGWGTVRSGGVHGRTGLREDEALHLMTLQAFVSGWLEATCNEEKDALATAVLAEAARVEALSAPKQ